MKLVILFNFLLITIVTTAPHKRTRRKFTEYDEIDSSYDQYESNDMCNNFLQNRRNEVECKSDSQTISLKLKMEFGSISVKKSFATTNAERKPKKSSYVRGHQGETYNSDTNSFSTNINLPHSSLSFAKSYRKVSGC